MSQVRIVTDSVSDIPADMREALGIAMVPAVVVIDGVSYRDQVELSSVEFYRRLAQSRELPTTSQPPVGEFEKVYRQLARETDEIISIHIPAALSGTIRSAQAAAAMIEDARVTIVDSTQISMALGWLVILAARAAREGRSRDEILALVEETIPRLRLVAVLDTLEYARRGGRIGRATAMMGTMLRVKPLIGVRDSEVVPLENVRTMRRAIARLLEIVSEWAPLQEAAVIHTAAPELAEEVRQRLGRFHPPESILVVEAGPVLGTHAGPRAVGIACVCGQ
jgi:DegV family protein with EDD domain